MAKESIGRTNRPRLLSAERLKGNKEHEQQNGFIGKDNLFHFNETPQHEKPLLKSQSKSTSGQNNELDGRFFPASRTKCFLQLLTNGIGG
jgi:hypothetical protein